MDGVLADFAGHFEAVFGWRPDQEDDVDWTVVRQVEDFHSTFLPWRTCNCFGTGSSAISLSF
jgi:hypothetical protein